MIIAAAAVSAYAQPRAMGIRFGAGGLEADYQHDMRKNQFIEGNLGMDFGAEYINCNITGKIHISYHFLIGTKYI